MDLKVILRYGILLYVLLVLSGIPMGYIIAKNDPLGMGVPNWLILYKYLAVFLISCLCFHFLIRSKKNKPFVHGLIVVIVVSGVSSVVEFWIFPEFNYFGWLLDFFIILFSLVVTFGFSFLLKSKED